MIKTTHDLIEKLRETEKLLTELTNVFDKNQLGLDENVAAELCDRFQEMAIDLQAVCIRVTGVDLLD